MFKTDMHQSYMIAVLTSTILASMFYITHIKQEAKLSLG